MIDWVKFVIERQRERNEKCYDVFEYVFVLVKDIDTRFHFSSATALIKKAHLGNCGVWIHEFTEMSLIQLLNDWGMPWRNTIHFGKRGQRIPHIIAVLIESGIKW